MSTIATAQTALDRWLAALNSQGKSSSVQLACDREIEVHRYVPGVEAAAAIFKGHDMVEVWVRRTPESNHFELVEQSVKQLDDGWWEARYRVRADAWVNEGTWRFRTSDESRLVELHHRPDPLKE